MTVYLGTAGHIELVRTSVADALTGNIVNSFVNTTRDMFSFDYETGTLLTGDFVEFKTTDGTNLDFIAASGWADSSVYPLGNWFVNIDQLGAIRLYNEFSDALAGESTGRIALASIARTIPIVCSVVNNTYRTFGEVTSYELTTDRETVDTSSLGDEFRQQYSTLITGSGQLNCFFDYRDGGQNELAIYLHKLLLRQKFGSEFKAKLYILSEGYGQGINADNDTIWHEITGIVTQVGIQCNSEDLLRSTISFVTTGEIKLKVQTITGTGYLLQQSGSKIRLEDSSGFVTLEETD